MSVLSLAAAALLWLWAPADDSQKPNDKTLGKKPPQEAVVLFSGGSLDGWVKRDGATPAEWPVSGDIFTVGPGKGNILTSKEFGDQYLHVEFNVAYMPDAKGQARGNSGVYIAGVYELQVLDSYGLDSQKNDCAAIYNQIAPSVNACKPPLQWQTYDIVFRKARLKDGEVAEKARVTVLHNGVVVIDNQEITATPGGTSMEEGKDGPLLLQDHGNDVQFRNIWIVPLDDLKPDLKLPQAPGAVFELR
jgi:hypothetical protein